MSVALPPDSPGFMTNENLNPKSKRPADKSSKVAQKRVKQEPVEVNANIVGQVTQISAQKNRGAKRVEDAAPLTQAKRRKENVTLNPEKVKRVLERAEALDRPVTESDLKKACVNPSIAAILSGKLEALAKVPVNHTPDEHGYTPLYYALMLGDSEAVTLCLQSGADVRLKPPDTQWPIFTAVDTDNPVIVKAMLEADPKLINSYSETNLLLYAEETEKFESLKVLETHLEEIEQRSPDKPMQTVSELMQLSEADWGMRGLGQLHSKMEIYLHGCVPAGKMDDSTGYLEKRDLAPRTEIAVIGDIHGDGTRLDLTLKALQARGYLDENYHVVPGKKLVFLGDYVDRGEDNLKTLEMLITLKLENSESVTLIRGNHEDTKTSRNKLDRYAHDDVRYYHYMSNRENIARLNRFYEGLPVAVYMGQKDDKDTIQYMQFCHGLFHLYTDPAPLLDHELPQATLWVKGTFSFSPRVQQILDVAANSENLTKKEQKMHQVAAKLRELEEKIEVNFTNIYWLDAGPTFAQSPSSGRYTIPPEMVKAYLQASSSSTRKVKEVMRGHQGGIWTVKGETQKVVVTTLDPSKDQEKQTFMELKIAPKVRGWQRSLVSLPLSTNYQEALQNITAIDANSL